MKLAEALSLRKDLERRIFMLIVRIENLVRVQEDFELAEIGTLHRV